MVEIHDANLYEPGKPEKESLIGEVILDAAADALHGDALIFLRLGKQMVTVSTTSEGLLAIGGEGVMALGSSTLSAGIAQPWEHI